MGGGKVFEIGISKRVGDAVIRWAELEIPSDWLCWISVGKREHESGRTNSIRSDRYD